MVPSAQSGKWSLIYDDYCSICQFIVQKLGYFGLLSIVQVVPASSVENQSITLSNRLRIEIVLINNETQEIIGGADAISWLLQQKSATRWVGQLSQFPILHLIAIWLYRTISYNRRIIAPLKNKGIACACDPPFHLGYRISFWLLVASFFALFGFLAWLVIAFIITILILATEY